MLQLFVAQRRRDSSQGGRARWALAASPHYVLVAVQFYVIKDSYIQMSEVTDLLCRRSSGPATSSALQLHRRMSPANEWPRATVKMALTRLEEGLLLAIPVRVPKKQLLEAVTSQHHFHEAPAVRDACCTVCNSRCSSDLYFISLERWRSPQHSLQPSPWPRRRASSPRPRPRGPPRH